VLAPDNAPALSSHDRRAASGSASGGGVLAAWKNRAKSTMRTELSSFMLMLKMRVWISPKSSMLSPVAKARQKMPNMSQGGIELKKSWIKLCVESGIEGLVSNPVDQSELSISKLCRPTR